ncbi:SGNH/GDSL hydrolase family protein [Pseudodesulfovibrio sediminis]|uniref:Glycosyltransferase family 1 protein n=1 Tax=Pseudodesulfovibrio sediminis TaxID=2810563 RepID=A0ABN6EW44_9BACT|nr:SGNH/GDSL hydrolase family protein [Pseudodesulfovibrio sediminis]BCS89685.1 hypothetical protein PSDVSF_29270 [Pseudodesulfovibrio sediminis]
MLYFLGNCQMDFLSRAMADHGHDVRYRVLASPLTYSSHPGAIPAELNKLAQKHRLDTFFHDRSLDNQFCMISRDEAPPECIIMSLFHENVPLFVHHRDKYVFFMDPTAWFGKPELEAWIKAECGMFKPNPATYLKRYGEYLATVRSRFSDVPIVVVSRLHHFPAFGPDPYSYLMEWHALSREAPAHFRVWQRELNNVHLVDMNRIFGGIWAEGEQRIEAHCPFLKIKLEEENDRVVGLHASRDVEHIGSMWPRLARTVSTFLDSGEISYAETETIPRAWSRPWQPSRFDESGMLEKLASGGNYLWAETVAGFFLDLQSDYTPLLARMGHLMPVCHNTLHMIKAYGRIFKNPELTQWCDAHRKTAEQFTANGPTYQADYLRRLDAIKAFALN